jgi:hypothetical protein
MLTRNFYLKIGLICVIWGFTFERRRYRTGAVCWLCRRCTTGWLNSKPAHLSAWVLLPKTCGPVSRLPFMPRKNSHRQRHQSSDHGRILLSSQSQQAFPEQVVALTDSNKWGGSGILQYFRGSTRQLADAMMLMITLSDNTGTNLVLDALGETHERGCRRQRTHVALG